MIHILTNRLRFSTAQESGSLFAAMCINAFGAGMFYPFAMLSYQAATSLSVGTIGLALTYATLLTLLITPITGILVDRFSARGLVVASQVVGATGFLIYLSVSSALSLFLAAVIATAGTRMFYASFSVLIAEMVQDADRDHWYGLVGITQSIGSSISGFLASLVIGSIGMLGFRAVIIANTVCLVASATLIYRQKTVRPQYQPRESEQGYLTVLYDRAFLGLVASNIVFIMCSMLIGIALAIYATEAMHAPLWSVGMVGLLQTGLVVGLQGLVIQFIRGYRRTRAMLFAGCFWVVSCLFFASGVIVPSSSVVPVLIIAASTFTVAQLFYIPASRALAANFGTPSLRGRYIAIYELSWGLAAAATPAFFGVTYDVLPSAPWLFAVILVVVGMGLLRRTESSIPLLKNRPAT